MNIERAIWRSKISAATSSGCPTNILAPHFPHLALVAGRDGGKRLIAPHLLQTTRFSVICFYTRRARRCVCMLGLTIGAPAIHVRHWTWPAGVFGSELGQIEARRADKVVHLPIQVTT